MGEEQHSPGRVDAREAARQAIGYVDEMTGQPPEVVSGVEPAEDGGWRVTVEVLELSRVPETTDLLGCYQVVIGADGQPVSYRRVHRYHRGQADEEGSW